MACNLINLVSVAMGRGFESEKLDVKDVVAGWLKASEAQNREYQIYR